MIENKECLACGSPNLKKSLDLGNQPLANDYRTQPEFLDTYPLAVNLCTECYHLQLTHTVDPKEIYSNYLYVAGTSKTLKDYSDWFAGYVSENIVKSTNNVFDIGCNDGTQLNSFKKLDFNTYGIDPAENIYPESSKNHEIILGYFDEYTPNKIKVEFDAITAQNVFAHNPDPLNFLLTCKQMMSDHTLLFIQTSQADIVLNNEFDTIYHEHINFFNINSMYQLSLRAGLNLIDAIKTPIHGNSYVFVLSKTIKKPYYIKNLIDMESKLQKEQIYTDWENIVSSNTEKLKMAIRLYRARGFKIIGYGAAAKGNTLLNYMKEPLDIIIDDSILKQNRYTPGMNIPIKSIDILNTFDQNDQIVFVPLAWNFFTEISKKIKEVRNNPNDKFLKYFPEVKEYV